MTEIASPKSAHPFPDSAPERLDRVAMMAATVAELSPAERARLLALLDGAAPESDTGADGA